MRKPIEQRIKERDKEKEQPKEDKEELLQDKYIEVKNNGTKIF